jgi:phosphopantothenoylcysteine decarboxylase / phosphopantothenate---cysteine ligase
MGFAIANELLQRGAAVQLICGPTSQHPTLKGITIRQVTSAAQMLEACIEAFKHADACIMSAAVADYTPVEVAPQKIKKQESALTIELKKTTDILKTLGEQKRSGQVLIGFALETENEEQHAIEKLNKKNLDAIVLNSLNDAGAGFATDTNKITIIDRAGKKDIFTLKSKKEVAADICNKLEQLMGI